MNLSIVTVPLMCLLQPCRRQQRRLMLGSGSFPRVYPMPSLDCLSGFSRTRQSSRAMSRALRSSRPCLQRLRALAVRVPASGRVPDLLLLGHGEVPPSRTISGVAVRLRRFLCRPNPAELSSASAKTLTLPHRPRLKTKSRSWRRFVQVPQGLYLKRRGVQVRQDPFPRKMLTIRASR